MTGIAAAHPSDSRAQRDAELVILAALSERLGVGLAKASIATANGGRVEIDGASSDRSTLVEIFAHRGKVLSGQGRKLAQDVLKLTWVRQRAEATRIVLAVVDPVVERYLARPKAWLTQAIIDLGVEVVRVELDEETSAALERAQAEQYLGMKGREATMTYFPPDPEVDRDRDNIGPGRMVSGSYQWTFHRPSLRVNGVLTRELVRAAVDEGRALFVWPKSDADLDPLREEIGGLTGLFIYTKSSVDLGFLERAENLRWLDLEARPRGAVDFTKLPNLQSYVGDVPARLASLGNVTTLRDVLLVGTLPKSFPGFVAPIRAFSWGGARNAEDLPRFSNPEALVTFRRHTAARFDAQWLAAFTNLNTVDLISCSDVVNLGFLRDFPKLELLSLDTCGTSQGWDSIPATIPTVSVRNPAHGASWEWFHAAQARGWNVSEMKYLIERGESGVLFEVLAPDDDDDEDAEWGVVNGNTSWLNEALAVVRDTGGASGYDVQRVLKRMLRDMKKPGERFPVEFDAEAGSFSAYFRTREHAERFADEATSLANDHDRIVELLRRPR